MKLGKRTIIPTAVLLLVVIGVIVYLFIYNSDGNTTNNQAQRNCTNYDGRVEEQCADEYEGLTREEAVSKAKENGLLPKITLVDGKIQSNTDEAGSIIFIEIENGVVTRAYFMHDLP